MTATSQYGACEAIARLGVRASGAGVMEKLRDARQ